MTPTPILATKLHIPRSRGQIVPRPHLIERLDDSLYRNLTLVSAPAGFGKSTLVSTWAAGCDRPVAWLSLDDDDNDQTRFLSYVIAALQTISPNIGESALVALRSPQPPPTETLVAGVLNDIAHLSDSFVLVLDDYHVIDSSPVETAVAFLLEHLPPQMHLVVATREDPQLPLARLRGRGQLSELRVKDLRFTLSEAAAFLEKATVLDLSAEQVAALEARTEGWIAGLQLAALSLQGRADVGSFVESFSGSHRFVLDYLLEEVLQHQSDRVQAFLLRTSILDQLTARCVMPFFRSQVVPPRRPSKSSNARTCLSFHWTTSGVGTAITISSPICSDSDCTRAAASTPRRCRNYAVVPASGTRNMGSILRPFVTPRLPMTSNARSD